MRRQTKAIGDLSGSTSKRGERLALQQGSQASNKRNTKVLCTMSGTDGEAQGKPTAKLTKAAPTHSKYDLSGSTLKALGHPLSGREHAKTRSKSFFTSVLNFHKMSNLLIYRI